MAKISVEFDTKEKTLSVAIDGKTVENVAEVQILKSYYEKEGYQCSLLTKAKDEDNDMKTYTQLVASDSLGAKNEAAVESKVYAGFVEVPKVNTKLAGDIAKYLKG